MQQSRSHRSAAIIAFALVLVVSLRASGQNCQPNVELGGYAESTIAVNPLNPENIAVTWIEPDDLENDLPDRVRLRIRPDSLSPWSEPIAPIFPAGYEPTDEFVEVRSVDPVLAFDGSGRLFWLYLARHVCEYEVFGEGCEEAEEEPCEVQEVCVDLVIAEVDPETGDPIEAFQVTPFPSVNDKPWLAADTYTSLTSDRLYVAWLRADFVCSSLACFISTQPDTISLTYSDDHGETWSTPQILDGPTTTGPDSAIHPTHVAVGPPPNSNSNSPVYVAWHVADAPDNFQAEIGRVDVATSTDGGATWDVSMAFGAGEAAVATNQPPIIPGTELFALGSWQPWVLADPFSPGTVYIVANDDPDDEHGSGDDGDVYLVRSTDYGETWSTPTLVSAGPNDSWQLFPTAAIDPVTGCIAIMWVDNRNGAVNGKGNYLVDIFFTVSRDQGQTFLPDRQLNDDPLDPDHGAFPSLGALIGEYIGVAMAEGNLYAAWIGHAPGSQQVIFGGALNQCSDCPADVTGDDEVNAADLAILLGAWQTAPCGPPDLNDDATVDAADLALLLGAWGPCGASMMGGGHPSLEELMEELTNMGRSDLAELLESVWDEM